MDYRDTNFESTRDRILPTIRFEIAIRNTSTRTQKYGERYLLQIFVQQNPILLSQRYTLLEHVIRYILMPKPPEFGNIHGKINRIVSHHGLPLFLIDTKKNQD